MRTVIFLILIAGILPKIATNLHGNLTNLSGVLWVISGILFFIAAYKAIKKRRT